MKSIILHHLDSDLAEELERRAREQGRSLNQTAQELLRVALGLQETKDMDRTDCFIDLCGSWKLKDLREFSERSKGLRIVDLADWEC